MKFTYLKFIKNKNRMWCLAGLVVSNNLRGIITDL